jgi:hypothetical protein
MKGRSMTAQEIISDLTSQGFDREQIADAMCDGEYLASEYIDENTAAEVYALCRGGK